MSGEWGTAEFVLPRDAIAIDHAGVAITAVIHDDYTTLSWAVNLRGASWVECDVLAHRVAEVLRGELNGIADYEPDHG